MDEQLMISTVPQLYLLTNDDEFDLLYHKLDIALATGIIGLLQIRRKQLLAMPNGSTMLFKEAEQIIKLANKYQVPVVINDDIALAAKLRVGVHLGQEDGTIQEAKAQLLPDQIIGRTCYGEVKLVKKAQNEGASYAAMGALFSSTTKPNAALVSDEQLKIGCQQGIALCAIGGLTVDNVTLLAGIPLAYIAVVGDIMNLPADAIAGRCKQWQKVLARWQTAI